MQDTHYRVSLPSLASARTLCIVLLVVLGISDRPAAWAKGFQSPDDVITVNSPASNSSVSSTFTVKASSRPAVSGASIEGMIVWLDGAEYGPIIRANTLSVPVTTKQGAHVISVSAWDTSGATGFSPNYSISVQASPSHNSAAKVNYFVATSGSDSNPGTLSAPWLTIQQAMNNATPGSIVNIRAGTYHERLSLNVSGSPGHYITFQPYGFNVPAGGCGGFTGIRCGGDQVILDYAYLGTVTDGIPLLQISDRNYARIQGLTFVNLR